MTGKSHLQLVNDCDQFSIHEDTSCLYKFYIEGYDCCSGYMLSATVNAFPLRGVWKLDHPNRILQLQSRDLEQRTQRVKDTLIKARDTGAFEFLKRWTDELCSVYNRQRELIMNIKRSAAPIFGIVNYGVQLLAYQDVSADGEDLGIWIARRAKTKRTYPNMLDSTIGGGLRAGESPFDCLTRESAEEVSSPEDLIRSKARACGTVNYMCCTDARAGGELGLFTLEMQFTHEMRLPLDIIPRPGDNEDEKITLMNVDRLKSALAAGEFTPANECIVLDFFIRHGIITYEQEKDFIEIASRLHKLLPFPTA